MDIRAVNWSCCTSSVGVTNFPMGTTSSLYPKTMRTKTLPGRERGPCSLGERVVYEIDRKLVFLPLAILLEYGIIQVAPPPRDVPAGARLRDISFFLSPHWIFVCKACLRLPGRVATRVPDWRLMPGGCRPCAPFRERQPCAQSARCSGCVHRRGGPALASPLLAACLSAPVS